jgi:hypothetical protein
VRGLTESDERDAGIFRAQAGERRCDRRAVDVEWLGDDGGDARDRTRDEMLERSDRLHLFEYRATAHGVL